MNYVFEIYLQEVLNLHWTLSHMVSTVTEPGILTEKYVQYILFLFTQQDKKHFYIYFVPSWSMI